jgi:hypothetical protein
VCGYKRTAARNRSEKPENKPQLHDVQTRHRRPHIPVPEQLLHGPHVVAVLEQMRRKRVTHRVRPDPWSDQPAGQPEPLPSGSPIHAGNSETAARIVAPDTHGQPENRATSAGEVPTSSDDDAIVVEPIATCGGAYKKKGTER